MMAVTVAPIENKFCHMHLDETSRHGNSDTQSGLIMGGREYIGESNMCNSTDLDRENSVSSSVSATADPFVEGFKDNSPVADKSWNDVDTVTFSDLSERQLLSGEENRVDSQGPVHPKKFYSQGDLCNPQICDRLGHCISKPVGATSLEKESAFESDTRQSASPELCESQIPECFEKENMFQNGDMKQESLIDLCTSGTYSRCSPSASLACDVCHGRKAEDGNALDKQESTDTQKSTCHMNEFDQPLKHSKTVGAEICICGQKLHDKRLEQGNESSRKLKVESFHMASESEQPEEKDQASPFQSNSSHDNEHDRGIILCDNSGSITARGEHIYRISGILLANTSMNEKGLYGCNQGDNFESVSLDPCSQSNINESNGSSLQETGPSKPCALFGDSSAVLESSLNGEPSQFTTSLPVLSLSSIPHGGQESLSQENLSDNEMQRTSNLDFNRIDNKVQTISARNKDGEGEATILEVGKSTHEQENINLLPLEQRELKGDSMEPDSESLVVNAKVSDSEDLPVHTYESSPKEAEEVSHHSFEETTNTSKIEQHGTVLPPSDLGIVITSASKDKGALVITRAPIDEKQDIEEQGSGSGLPGKAKHSIESSNSLRMLLSSEASDREDKRGSLNDKVRKDRETFEHPHRMVPSSETGRCVNSLSQDESHVFPEKWYEDAEDDELTSANFSGPIAYSGPVSYSGPIPFSGSLSYRSDSSTSTRSFAFPILATDWTSSPVKMAQPDSRFFKRRKRWRFSCFCCKQSSTLYD